MKQRRIIANIFIVVFLAVSISGCTLSAYAEGPTEPLHPAGPAGTAPAESSNGMVPLGELNAFDLAKEASELHNPDSAAILKGKTIYLILPDNKGTSGVERKTLIDMLSCREGMLRIIYHGYDAEREKSAFETAIRNGADLILCDNADPVLSREAVASAKTAGIPTILMNTGISETGNAAVQFLTVRASFAKDLADKVAEQTEERADLILLSSVSDDERASDALRAFRKRLRKYKEIEIRNESVPKDYSQKETERCLAALLRKAPAADVLVCYNEQQVLTAASWLTEKKKDLKIVCLFGEGGEADDLLKDGTILATLVKPAKELAEQAGEAALAYFRDGRIEGTERRYVSAELCCGKDETAKEKKE